MRFSLRDLFWATALAGVGLSWWLDNQTKHAAIGQAQRLHNSLSLARQWQHIPRHAHFTGYMIMPSGPPDWTPLEEPLVKP